MIIDCHAHYEPRILDAEALLQIMDRCGVEKAALIPHLTDPPETVKSDFLMNVQRFMFSSNLLRPLGMAITATMYHSKGEWNVWYRKSGKAVKKFTIVKNPDNEGVARLLSRYPDRFLGWIFLNPALPDCMEQLEKWRHTPGMIGVKVHPFWHFYDMRALADIAARSSELGLPMLVHLGHGPGGDYQWLTDNFPSLKIIIAHLGVPYYQEAWGMLKSKPNVFMDISSTYHVDPSLLRGAVKSLGAQRLLFGSDSPYAHADGLLRIKQWVDALPITAGEKKMIFHGNFMRVTSR